MWCAATLVLVAGLMVSEFRQDRLGIWLCKPAASVMFVLTAVVNDPWRTPFSTCVTVGLVLGAVGDVLLIPHDKRAFLGGLVSFLLGHVMYVVAFGVRGVDVAASLGAMGALLIPLWFVGRWLLPSVEAKMKTPVLAYMAAISVMVAAAVGSVVNGTTWVLLLAAVAFFLSDLSVARDRFVRKEFLNRAWGLPLYYGAQVLFALCLHG
jgi:uncharacterized membrane protein YhhN